MTNLAWQFDVPEEHVRDGRTDAKIVSDRLNWPTSIQIKFSATPPENAYVSVFAHDY